MSALWGKKSKQNNDNVALTRSNEPARISKTLDKKLKAESKEPLGRRIKKLFANKAFLAGVAILFLLVGAGLAYTNLRQEKKASTESKQEDYQSLLSSVKELRNQDKDSEALLRLNKYYEDNPNLSKEQRYLVAKEIAAIYVTSGDSENGLKWQTIALENNPKPMYGDYLAMATVFSAKKDDYNTLKYLKLSLESLKSDNIEPKGGPRTKIIEHQIEQLEGKKSGVQNP